MSGTRYRSPEAFRQALEARIAAKNAEIPRGIQRHRQRCIFERFLARVTAHFGDHAVLKGGVALELLLQQARMTQDIDLGLRARPDELLLDLRRAGQLDLGDFLSFEVEPHPRHPTIDNEGMLYEGQRFRVEARLAGKLYGQPFGLDVALGDPMPLPPETRTGEDLLAFMGIEPIVVRVYAREVHVAEKLHAFHDAAGAGELAGEGPPRHRAAGDDGARRQRAAAGGNPGDVREPGDARGPSGVAETSRELGAPLCPYGAPERAPLAYPRGGLRPGRPLPGPGASRGGRDVGSRRLALAAQWLSPTVELARCQAGRTRLRLGGP